MNEQTYTITDKGLAYLAYSEVVEGDFATDFPYFDEKIFKPIEQYVTEELVIQLADEAFEINIEDEESPTTAELDDAAEFIGRRVISFYAALLNADKGGELG